MTIPVFATLNDENWSHLMILLNNSSLNTVIVM